MSIASAIIDKLARIIEEVTLASHCYQVNKNGGESEIQYINKNHWPWKKYPSSNIAEGMPDLGKEWMSNGCHFGLAEKQFFQIELQPAIIEFLSLADFTMVGCAIFEDCEKDGM
jgi:hypothetical protein